MVNAPPFIPVVCRLRLLTCVTIIYSIILYFLVNPSTC